MIFIFKVILSILFWSVVWVWFSLILTKRERELIVQSFSASCLSTIPHAVDNLYFATEWVRLYLGLNAWWRIRQVWVGLHFPRAFWTWWLGVFNVVTSLLFLFWQFVSLFTVCHLTKKTYCTHEPRRSCGIVLFYIDILVLWLRAVWGLFEAVLWTGSLAQVS